MRALLVGLVVVSGCQCLVPVGEDGGVTDGGRTGGGSATGGGGAATGGGGSTGGGSTGGGSTGGGATGGGAATGGGGVVSDAGTCATQNDCTLPLPQTVPQCSGAPGAWTCAFGACVPECSVGRTCSRADAGCIDCDAGVECVRPNNCPMMTRLLIESSTCGLSMVTLTATSLSSLPCTYGLQWPDGGTAGVVSFYGFNTVSGTIPELGGGCIGEQLPTGALRFGLGCPDCMMSVMPLN